MKKVISQLKVQLTALLLVGGLLMLANCAQAQSNLQPQPTNGVKIPISGTWVDNFDANFLLAQQISDLTGQVNVLSGVDQDLARYRLYFLELIQESIAAGVPLNKAIQLSFDKILGEVQPDSNNSTITMDDLNAMFNEVVELLTN